jgi:hypothetical protein
VLVNRDDVAGCPRCGRGLDVSGERLVCPGCKGHLVVEAEIRQLVGEMLAKIRARTFELVPLPFADREPVPEDPTITCPRCAAHMTRHTLYELAVDRCPAHGVWFDGAELEAALAKAAEPTWKASLKQKIAAGAGLAAFIGVELAILLLGAL